MNTPLKIRALIDPGSELSFISEQIVSFLHLGRSHSKTPIIGIGGTSSGYTRGLVRVTLNFIHSSLDSMSIFAHILTHLTTCLPSSNLNSLSWPTLNNIPLADPDFLTPGPIDLILGADYYSEFIRPHVIQHDNSNLIAQQTLFGWVILGPIPTSHHLSFTIRKSCSNDDLQSLLFKFWQLEEIPNNHSNSVTLSPEESLCEQHFVTTHYRRPDGKYVVRLPFVQTPS